ncbi:hypothetical protein tb265_45260 [Gemmatimonadetes bacterium T265]|nr:hypothetical protein tb265_45260 [Gemmatimonadetes bacterium T265]
MAVVLATVSQLAFTLLPLVDGWHGLGAGPHVEAAGVTAHYAHAEDTCAACYVGALTVHPTPTVRLAVASDPTPSTRARGGSAPPAAVPTASPSSPHRSRAPPTPD